MTVFFGAVRLAFWPKDPPLEWAGLDLAVEDSDRGRGGRLGPSALAPDAGPADGAFASLSESDSVRSDATGVESTPGTSDEPGRHRRSDGYEPG